MAKTKPTHGGIRKGAGRKKSTSPPLSVFSVRLTPEQAAFAEMLGGGDRSAGIRGLIDKAVAWSMTK